MRRRPGDLRPISIPVITEDVTILVLGLDALIDTIVSVELKEKLVRARKSLVPRVSQAMAGEILRLSREAYASYESGRVVPTPGQVRKLADAWEIPFEWFYDGLNTFPPTPPRTAEGRTQSDIGAAMYPVAGATVEIPMSSPVPGGSWLAPEESTTFYEIPVRLYKKGRWASPAVGASNFPYIQQGDVLIWEPKPHPPVGRIILAQNGDTEVTVKQLQYGETGHVLIGLKDGDEIRAPQWSALAMLIARIREPGPGRYSEVSNEGGLTLDELD